MSRVLAIGDLHLPVCHPNYLWFCQDTARSWKCDTIVLLGDVIDHHAISFHARHPDCPGPKDEFELANSALQPWVKAFPKAFVCIGNHDERPGRLAESVNIPALYLRNHAEVWQTKSWTWGYETVIDGVLYCHGTGLGGAAPAAGLARSQHVSVVCGHAHSKAGVVWSCGPTTRIFGMDAGCGIDRAAWQFAYGRHQIKKPVLACGVILDGIPYHEIMPVGAGEKYHREAS